MNDLDAPKPKRRWYQFKMRTLLLIVAAVSVVCAWYLRDFSRRIRRERNAREVAEASAPIRELGGSVGFSRVPSVEGKGAIVSVSFEKRVILDVNGKIFKIIDGRRLTDDDLKQLRPHLESLPGLRCLDLRQTHVTDEGLAHLKGLQHLEVLELEGDFTGAGLEYLRNLPNLWCVNIQSPFVTDASLEYLCGMTNIRSLSLHRTKVSDEGFKKLHDAFVGRMATKSE